jgi:GcrA cell cycle regulator
MVLSLQDDRVYGLDTAYDDVVLETAQQVVVAGRQPVPRSETMQQNDWTPERTAALIALWNEDLSTSEIGRRLGITKNAVIGKVHRLGLQQRRPSPKARIEVLDVLRLDRLRPGMCSWPIGEPNEPNFHFCGEPIVEGKPYCASHCAKAYVKVRDRADAVAEDTPRRRSSG